VADDGPGLADPDAAFTPGWSTKECDGGDRRGLGLALVRRVVDRRGGRLEVGAGPGGRGTVFTVTLPVTPPVSPPVGSQPPAASR
jgi:two-component system, CitB family, sensor kinase